VGGRHEPRAGRGRARGRRPRSSVSRTRRSGRRRGARSASSR
jgi:hypothetical protein